MPPILRHPFGKNNLDPDQTAAQDQSDPGLQLWS